MPASIEMMDVIKTEILNIQTAEATVAKNNVVLHSRVSEAASGFICLYYLLLLKETTFQIGAMMTVHLRNCVFLNP